MRCSRCSEDVKPVVAIDIDGTLGNYHRHFIKFATGYFNFEPPAELTYAGDIPFKAWAKEVWKPIGDREWKDCKLAYRQGGMKRTMPPYPFANELCELVRAMDAELWLTTTRPAYRLDNVDPDTQEWLRRNRIVFDGLLFDEEKYRKLAERIEPGRVVAVVDDLPEEIENAVSAFGSDDIPIWRRTRFNELSEQPIGREPELPIVFDTRLPMIGRIIERRINEWNKENV